MNWKNISFVITLNLCEKPV